jgi:hypothetical protein
MTVRCGIDTSILVRLATGNPEDELAEAATCKDYLQVRQEGTREVSRNLCHYRLKGILADGILNFIAGIDLKTHAETQET